MISKLRAGVAWRRWSWLAAAAAIAGLAGGCGSGGGDGGGGATTDAKAPASATVAFTDPIVSLDPALAFRFQETNVLHQVGGNLFEERGDGQIVPGLASGADVSGDGRTWTIRLRPGLTFSDGTPLTSADVKATFERAIATPNTYAGFFKPIRAIATPDKTTVTLSLSRPYPSLRTLLAHPGLAIFPARRLGQKGFFDAPVSAGPYRLVSWDGRNSAVLAVNERYWGPKPVVRTLHFDAVEDFNTRLAQLKAGQIQMAIDLPPSLLPQLDGKDGIDAGVVLFHGWSEINIWNGKAPLNDARVRRAISLAVDRKQLDDVIWQGNSPTATAFWPQTMTGYEAALETPRDVAAAKRELAGTACANGCKLTLEYSLEQYSWAEQAAQIIASNLKDAGIDVTLVKETQQALSTNQIDGRYQLALYGLYDFFDIPDGMLLYGLVKDGGYNANASGYFSPQMEAIAKRAMTTDGAERTAALADVNRQFVKDMPYVPLSVRNALVAQRISPQIISVQPTALIDVERGEG